MSPSGMTSPKLTTHDVEPCTEVTKAAAPWPLSVTLPQPLPDPTWTALYERLSCVNHSCRPNAEVHFLDEDHTATLIATRDIAAGDEIFISYIDDNERANFELRRDSLRDYGFVCDCEKCEAELTWRRRLRPRRQR